MQSQLQTHNSLSLAGSEVHPVRRVHIVFKTHLDIGYTDRPWRVVDRFLDHHVPRAIATSRSLRERGGPEQLIWTLGSWVVEQALSRGDLARRRLVEQAVEEGSITWHGLPLSLHSELMDLPLFESALAIAAHLDERFGRKTIAAKMTDVPGHTVGIVPALAAAGLKFLHVGVNPQSSVPSVPPAFRWQGVGGSEIVVAYNDEYGGVHRRRKENRPVRELVSEACSQGEANPYRGVVRFPGSDEALLVYMTGDNVGPPSSDDVIDTFAALREHYPAAEIVASTLDGYARAALADTTALPVLTQEIGDSWIHGAGADPLLLARYRELLRIRHRYFEQGRLDAAGVAAIDNHLLLVPEHTFGLDTKAVIGQGDPYDGPGFLDKLASGAYRALETGWEDKASHIEAALDALPSPALRKEAADALERIGKPAERPTIGSALSSGQPLTLENGYFAVELDRGDGSIARLIHKPTNRNWADQDHRLFSYEYQTFSIEDYRRFFQEYIRHSERENYDVVAGDYGKPGLDRALAHSGVFHAHLETAELAVSQSTTTAVSAPGTSTTIAADLVVAHEPGSSYGAPRRLRLLYTLFSDEDVLHVELQRLDKLPCRLPEAEWVRFQPLVSESASWCVDKVGSWVPTTDVVGNAGRGLHAVGAGAKVDDGTTLLLETLDTALVAPGRKALLRAADEHPLPDDGIYINLSNNVWGTNFRAWNGGDLSFRFLVRASG